MSSRQDFFNIFNISDMNIMGSMLPVLLVRKGELEPFAEIVTRGDHTKLVVNGDIGDNGIRVVIS